MFGWYEYKLGSRFDLLLFTKMLAIVIDRRPKRQKIC